MSSTTDKLVERYLKHLEVELDDLPRDRRREIVDEISGHIAEARAALEHETEADVRNILEGLGDPADIAVDARERFEVRPTPTQSKTRWMEITALIMLLAGGLILPGVGWLIGVVLLWVSNVWNVRDKILGTLVLPGGLLLPLGLAFTVGASSDSVGCPVPVGTPVEPPSCNTTSGGIDVLAVTLFVVAVLAPFVTTAYLAYRMRRLPAATA
jgi:HAAS domain-containing protein